jgi:recombination protein RecR
MENKLIKQLIQQFGKLPGVNSRQAKKIIAYLLEELSDGMLDVENMILSLDRIKNETQKCLICNNVIICDEKCAVCKKNERFQFRTICVVENIYELWRISNLSSIESSFHVLGGVISATNGVSPDMLNTGNLIERIEDENTREIIIALNKNYNSILTANYLSELLRRKFPNLIVSTLAGGLPSGAELDFIDDKTLEIAINSRVLC